MPGGKWDGANGEKGAGDMATSLDVVVAWARDDRVATGLDGPLGSDSDWSCST